MSRADRERREEVIREHWAYTDGRQAFRDGKPQSHCPHLPNHGNSKARMLWFAGWYDERNKRFFEKAK